MFTLLSCGNLAKRHQTQSNSAKQNLRKKSCSLIEISSSNWTPQKTKNTLVCLLASHPQKNYDSLLWQLARLNQADYLQLAKWLNANYADNLKREKFLNYIEATPQVFGQLFLFSPFHKIIGEKSFYSLSQVLPHILKVLNSKFSTSNVKNFNQFLSTYSKIAIKQFRALEFSNQDIAEDTKFFKNSLTYFKQLSPQQRENVWIHSHHVLDLATQFPALQHFIARFAHPISCDIKGTKSIIVPLEEIIQSAHLLRDRANVFQSYLMHTLSLWRDVCVFQDLSPNPESTSSNPFSQNEIETFLKLLFNNDLFFSLAELGRHNVPSDTIKLFSLFVRFSISVTPHSQESSFLQAFMQGQGSFLVENIILNTEFLTILDRHADDIASIFFATHKHIQQFPKDIELAQAISTEFNSKNFNLWQSQLNNFLLDKNFVQEWSTNFSSFNSPALIAFGNLIHSGDFAKMMASLKFWTQIEDLLLPTSKNPDQSTSATKNPQHVHPSSSITEKQNLYLNGVFQACLAEIFDDNSSSHIQKLIVCFGKYNLWGLFKAESLDDPRVQKFLTSLEMSPEILEFVNYAIQSKALTATSLHEFWTPYIEIVQNINLPLGPLLEWLASGYKNLSEAFIKRFVGIYNSISWNFKEPQMNFHVEKNLQENIAGPKWNVFVSWLKEHAAEKIYDMMASKQSISIWQDLDVLSKTKIKLTLYLYNEQKISIEQLKLIYPDLKNVSGAKDTFTYTAETSMLTMFDQLIWELQLAPLGEDQKSLARATKLLLALKDSDDLRKRFKQFKIPYNAKLNINILKKPYKKTDPRSWSKIKNTLIFINAFLEHPKFVECFSIVRLIKQLIPRSFNDSDRAEFVKALHGLGLLRSIDRVIQSEARFLSFLQNNDLSLSKKEIILYYENTFVQIANKLDQDNLAKLAELNLWFDGNLAHVGLHALIAHMINEWDNVATLPDDGKIIGWLGEAILDLMLPFFNEYYQTDSYDYAPLNRLTKLLQNFRLETKLFFLTTKIAAEGTL